LASEGEAAGSGVKLLWREDAEAADEEDIGRILNPHSCEQDAFSSALARQPRLEPTLFDPITRSGVPCRQYFHSLLSDTYQPG
jgi:hypothetical protein